jgi:hypothetical protein
MSSSGKQRSIQQYWHQAILAPVRASAVRWATGKEIRLRNAASAMLFLQRRNGIFLPLGAGE